MNRRRYLLSSAIFGALGALRVFAPVTTFAAEECRPSPLGAVCSSFIPIQKLAKVYAQQQLPEWCWAASISMIFGFYNHWVSQSRIVEEAYGLVANMPGTYPALLESLNRQWSDDGGLSFGVSIDNIFAPELGALTLSNQGLISALQSDVPVLYCTVTHAMVLTAIRYLPTPLGPRLLEAWVMDPFPGRGLRRLMPAEMVPFPMGGLVRMAATITVSDS